MIQWRYLDSLRHADRRKAWARGPKMTWKTLTKTDRCEWDLNKVDPCYRDVWRSTVRSAMYAASQLPGKEPTDVDDDPASAR